MWNQCYIYMVILDLRHFQPQPPVTAASLEYLLPEFISRKLHKIPSGCLTPLVTKNCTCSSLVTIKLNRVNSLHHPRPFGLLTPQQITHYANNNSWCN